MPSTAQFHFPECLEEEFQQDPEFRQRVVGLERMLRVRDSLKPKEGVTSAGLRPVRQPKHQENEEVKDTVSGSSPARRPRVLRW